MESYRTMNDGMIQRQSDLALIPPTTENPDYVQFLEDQGNGAEVLPFDYEAEALRQEGLARQNKFNALAAYRHEREIAGITVDGVTICTDRESQAMINGAVAYVGLNPEALIDWKGDSEWVQIDRATVLAIGQAVGAHVQACFSREKVHATAIAALATAEEVEAYDFTTGWPG